VTKLAAVFPVELALHALVVDLRLSYLRTAMLLAVSATIMVVWVVEPSAMRLLGRWLHGPELQRRDRPRCGGNVATSSQTGTDGVLCQQCSRTVDDDRSQGQGQLKPAGHEPLWWPREGEPR
jgi:hypothetical protein